MVNDLEKNIKQLNEKEKRLLEKISHLEFELITNKKINEKNTPIKQEEYESIIKKLKKKFQEEKELYKLNEIKYIDRIEELAKLNKELNIQIENLENEILNNSNNSNSLIKNSFTFYKSKTPKKNYSINYFGKKKFNFSSIKEIKDYDSSLNSNLSSPKYIDYKKNILLKINLDYINYIKKINILIYKINFLLIKIMINLILLSKIMVKILNIYYLEILLKGKKNIIIVLF